MKKQAELHAEARCPRFSGTEQGRQQPSQVSDTNADIWILNTFLHILFSLLHNYTYYDSLAT